MNNEKDSSGTSSSFPESKYIKTEAAFKDVKRRKQFEDIDMETVAEIVAIIDDPNYMTGPGVIIFLFKLKKNYYY